MKMQRLLSVVMLTVLCGVVFGLTPMGPSAPQLNKGQWEFGVDYSYSQQDIQANHGFSPGGGPKLTMKNMKAHYLAAKGSYGISENWEMFMRLGGGSMRGTETKAISFNSNYNGYAIGFGTKIKLFNCEHSGQWGALFQFMWAQADGRVRAGGTAWTAEEDLFEMQIALGPTYQMNEKVKLYGGPFFHVFDGDLVAKSRPGGARINYDLDQGSYFGGYVGGQIGITENTVLGIEWQHTATADALGLSWAYRF